MNPVTVVIADDHPMVVEGLSGMLGASGVIEVIGTAHDGREAVSKVAALHPDVVLMDLRMPVMGGVEATRAVRASSPDTTVVVLTSYDTDADILHAIEAGASGYLLKDIAADELARAIVAAAHGDTVLSQPVERALMTRLRGEDAPSLSAQEVAVLERVAQGLTNAQIASGQHLSESTVKTYLARAFSKLGVSDRTSAVVRAQALGLITTQWPGLSLRRLSAACPRSGCNGPGMRW